MIDYVGNLNTAKKRVSDYLASPYSDTSATAKSLEKTRSTMSGNLNDVMSGIAGRYGLPSSVAPAGYASGARVGTELGRKSAESLDRRSLTERRARMNQIYNYVFDSMVQSGADAQSADEFARQMALEQDQQTFQSGMSEQARQKELKKQNIASTYTDLAGGIKVDTGDPYQEAMTRALMGLGGSLATGYLLTRKPKVRTPAYQYGTLSSYGTSDPGRVNPYTSNFGMTNPPLKNYMTGGY